MGRKRKMLCGVGYNTCEALTKENGNTIFEYTLWKNMIKRCYDARMLDMNITYKEKYVCTKWLDFKNFKKWVTDYPYYQKGWDLDKDILIKGNNVYSSDTCTFVPHRINSILVSQKPSRGNLPVGVHFDKSRGKYKATCCNEFGKQWQKRYSSEEDAFNAYKKEKERVLKAVADQYKDSIDPRVYQALYKYEVSIND